jgi:hypothetical protein
MISANINLKAILCHVTDEQSSGAEPYMWTSFFYMDAKTWFSPGKKIVTYAPHADWTTRGVFPDGIRAGDIVEIPASLGSYQATLDPAEPGIAMAGTIFVLLDQEHTPGGAIRAGHEAFAAAIDDALNDYVDSVTDIRKISPTAEQIKMIADQVQGRVTSAIRAHVPFYDAVRDQDQPIGFGYQILGPDVLRGMAARPYGSASFTNRITSTRTVEGIFGTLVFFNDYEVFGEVSVVDDDQPPGEANDQYEVYQSAAARLKSIDGEILETVRQLRKSPAERRELIARLRRLRHDVRPLALETLADARVGYLSSQGHVLGGLGTHWADPAPSRMRQSGACFFPESALVVPPRMVDEEGPQAILAAPGPAPAACLSPGSLFGA